MRETLKSVSCFVRNKENWIDQRSDKCTMVVYVSQKCMGLYIENSPSFNRNRYINFRSICWQMMYRHISHCVMLRWNQAQLINKSSSFCISVLMLLLFEWNRLPSDIHVSHNTWLYLIRWLGSLSFTSLRVLVCFESHIILNTIEPIKIATLVWERARTRTCESLQLVERVQVIYCFFIISCIGFSAQWIFQQRNPMKYK